MNVNADRRPAAAVIAALCAFAVLVAGKFHGYSTGAWDAHVRDTLPSYSRPVLGTDRQIRSDEWCVSTPQVLAQCASPDFFPRVNRRVGGGTDMFVATPCNPVWDWTAPGQFHNWGFFLFGAERGLAWNWWCRFLGLPLFAFLFFLGWLGRDGLLAATAALAVALGAPTQWWDTTLPYLLLYFFAGLVFLRAVVSPETGTAARALSALGLFVSLASYAFAGYPPFAVMLFPAFLVLGWQILRPAPCAGSADAERLGTCAPKSGLWLAAVALALAAELAYFAAVHSVTLKTISGSSYPGGRVFLGGSFPAFLRAQALDVVGLFSHRAGFREEWLSAFGEPNPCRAARYFVPGAGLFALLASRRRLPPGIRRSDAVLLAWALWLTLWNAVPFPRRLAVASGMFPFPPHRAEVVAGFVAMLAVFRLFSLCAGRSRVHRRAAAAAAAVSAAFLAASAAAVAGGAGGIATSARGVLFLAEGAAMCAAATAGLVSGNRKLFCAGYAALSLAGGLAVHPFSRGVSPLADKELAALVRDVDGRQPGRWMSNSHVTGNFLLAQGLDCEPGTQTYARPDFWAAVDPAGAFRREWNRYGHRSVRMSADGECEVASAGDVIRFSVTQRALRDLGIAHLVWSGEKLREPWLRFEGRSRLHFVYTLLPEESDPGPPPAP